MRVFIDTNVLLDFLLDRNPFCEEAEKIMSLCKDNKIIGFVAAHSILNMFYILRKDFSDADRRELLIDICSLCSICAINKGNLIATLHKKEFKDFEDALQYQCAKENYADCIITRNKKDFVLSDIPIYTPSEFISRGGNLNN